MVTAVARLAVRKTSMDALTETFGLIFASGAVGGLVLIALLAGHSLRIRFASSKRV